MKQTQFALYVHTSEYGKRRTTTWKLTPEGAAELKEPVIVPDSIEMRDCPETPDESMRGRFNYPSCKPPDRSEPG